jgi:hypothetical protein
MFTPLNDDPRVGQMLARHVLHAAVNPLVYITNGEVEDIEEGQSVTFEAHVTGGGIPGYSYHWSIREEGDVSWSTVGGNSSTWTWNPAPGEAGTYAVRCTVTDSQPHSGEAIWEGFVITAGPGGEVPIPTLSEWGIIILMTIMMGISILILVRRRKTFERIHRVRRKNF